MNHFQQNQNYSVCNSNGSNSSHFYNHQLYLSSTNDELNRENSTFNTSFDKSLPLSTPQLRTTPKKSMYVRALFDYDPTQDNDLPGRVSDISFFWGGDKILNS